MVIKSILSQISKPLRGKKEKTSEQLDRELEQAVSAIRNKKARSLKASSVMSNALAQCEGAVFILSLPPIYDAIGGRQGRLAENLRDSCVTIFKKKINLDRGYCAFEGDNFVMRFNAKKKVGFHLAADIINAIGTNLLRDRFKTMNVNGLLVVANAANITDDNGSLNSIKIKATVKSGGVPLEMNQPGPDAPRWVKLFWKSNSVLTVARRGKLSQKVNGTDSGAKYYGKGEDIIWTTVENTPGDGPELIQRGAERRQAKSVVHPSKERRTCWQPRRMADCLPA